MVLDAATLLRTAELSLDGTNVACSEMQWMEHDLLILAERQLQDAIAEVSPASPCRSRVTRLVNRIRGGRAHARLQALIRELSVKGMAQRWPQSRV